MKLDIVDQSKTTKENFFRIKEPDTRNSSLWLATRWESRRISAAVLPTCEVRMPLIKVAPERRSLDPLTLTAEPRPYPRYVNSLTLIVHLIGIFGFTLELPSSMCKEYGWSGFFKESDWFYFGI